MPASIPWPGRSPRGSLVLPLPWSFVPPLAMTFDLPEAPFARKAELHLTLLSRREADAAATTLPVDEWPDWYERHDWRPRLTDRWFLLQAKADDHVTRSVVAEVECDALNAFRREFGYAAAVTLEATLPHVTLWTDDAPNGIGIASLADFETKCVRRLTARERQSGIASEKSGTVPDS